MSPYNYMYEIAWELTPEQVNQVSERDTPGKGLKSTWQLYDETLNLMAPLVQDSYGDSFVFFEEDFYYPYQLNSENKHLLKIRWHSELEVNSSLLVQIINCLNTSFLSQLIKGVDSSDFKVAHALQYKKITTYQVDEMFY